MPMKRKPMMQTRVTEVEAKQFSAKADALGLSGYKVLNLLVQQFIRKPMIIFEGTEDMGKHGPVDGSRQGQPSTSEKNTTRQHVETDVKHEPKHAKPEGSK